VSAVFVVIQLSVELETHEHSGPVVTKTTLELATAVIVRVVGVMPKKQLFPACEIVTVRPAIVIVPVRRDVLSVGSTLNDTGPLPVPLAPPVIVIQGTLLAAVQLQAAVVVTAEDPVPPVAPIEIKVGATVNEQVPAPCVTVKNCPAMLRVALRIWVLVLAAALKLTDALPVPLAALVIVSQLVSLLAAVQGHPFAVVSAVEPVPPPAATDWLPGDSEYVHADPACDTV
jgi:hypothetical protein